MKDYNKVFLKSFFIAGLVYSILIAGHCYSEGQDFSFLKFLFHFTFFGLFINYYKKWELIHIHDEEKRSYLQGLVFQKKSHSYINQMINSIKF